MNFVTFSAHSTQLTSTCKDIVMHKVKYKSVNKCKCDIRMSRVN